MAKIKVLSEDIKMLDSEGGWIQAKRIKEFIKEVKLIVQDKLNIPSEEKQDFYYNLDKICGEKLINEEVKVSWEE